MSPRTGRPKAENPKNQRFSIRLDDQTGKRLDKYCDKMGMNRAAAIRFAINLLLDKK